MMRGTMSILVTILICIVVFVLYFFLGKGQINKQIDAVKAENRSQQQRLGEIDRMAAELPRLMKQLPDWKEQLALYKRAIPEPISDDEFLSALAHQMELQGVKLLTLEVIPEGRWLGEIGEQQEEQLRAKGIDPDQARQVLTAYYTINLLGNFEDVLAAFENLKQYRRLYTIDEVTGPAGRAPGAITQVVDPNITPIELSGRLYYGIEDSYLTDADLIRVFESSVIKPLAKRIQIEVAAEGQQLLGPPSAPPSADADAGAEPDETATDAPEESTSDDEAAAENIARADEAFSAGQLISAGAAREG